VILTASARFQKQDFQDLCDPTAVAIEIYVTHFNVEKNGDGGRQHAPEQTFIPAFPVSVL
jgi:hypothetical protein